MKPPYEFVSNDAQLIQAERFAYTEGRAKGTEGCRIENGKLGFTVLVDRCLDIYDLRFSGKLISYLSETGVVHPAYYEAHGSGWLRSFCAGFLTTCGLTQAGEPCAFGGEAHGLHGRISNIPAQNVAVSYEREGGQFSFCISGEVRQTCHQKENLVLRRRIRTRYGTDTLVIEDEIRNEGASSSPLMLLYHFNFGYPFLCGRTTLSLPPALPRGFDKYSEQHKDLYNEFGRSAMDRELTLVHELLHRGETCFHITDGETSIRFSYDNTHLPYIAQWRHLFEKSYVLGVEPCNNHINGVAWEADHGALKWIEPGAAIANKFDIEFSEAK